MRTYDGGTSANLGVYDLADKSPLNWDQEQKYRRRGITITGYTSTGNSIPTFGTASYLFRDSYLQATSSGGTSSTTVWADLKTVRNVRLDWNGTAGQIYPASLERESGSNGLNADRAGAQWVDGVRMASHNVFQVFPDEVGSQTLIRPEQAISVRFYDAYTTQNHPPCTTSNLSAPIYFTGITASDGSGNTITNDNDGWNTSATSNAMLIPGRMVYQSNALNYPAYRPAVIICDEDIETITGLYAYCSDLQGKLNSVITWLNSGMAVTTSVTNSIYVRSVRQDGAHDVATERYHP